MKLIVSGSVSLVSVDVFDTVLLRTTKPEVFRFWQMADRFRAALAHGGYPAPSREDVFAARLLACRAAYRNAIRREGSEEVEIQELYRLMLLALGVPPEAATLLLESELAYETTELRANGPLISALRRARAQGKRVIYASDMYLPAAFIDRLLQVAGLGDLFDAGYSSADNGLSKRSGALFRFISARERTEPARSIHLGDNYVSDVLRPAEQGWQSLHVPRSLAWRTAVSTRQRLVMLDLWRRGLAIP